MVGVALRRAGCGVLCCVEALIALVEVGCRVGGVGEELLDCDAEELSVALVGREGGVAADGAGAFLEAPSEGDEGTFAEG